MVAMSDLVQVTVTSGLYEACWGITNQVNLSSPNLHQLMYQLRPLETCSHSANLKFDMQPGLLGVTGVCAKLKV